MFVRWVLVRVALVGAVAAIQTAATPHAAVNPSAAQLARISADGAKTQAAAGYKLKHLQGSAWAKLPGPTSVAAILLGLTAIGYARRANVRQLARITV